MLIWENLYPPPFYTGLVHIYITGLPLRSCQTIGLPSVGGSPNVRFSVAVGFEPTSLSSRCGCFTGTLSSPPSNLIQGLSTFTLYSFFGTISFAMVTSESYHLFQHSTGLFISRKVSKFSLLSNFSCKILVEQL